MTDQQNAADARARAAAEARAQDAQQDRSAQPREAGGSDQRGIVTREGGRG